MNFLIHPCLFICCEAVLYLVSMVFHQDPCVLDHEKWTPHKYIPAPSQMTALLIRADSQCVLRVTQEVFSTLFAKYLLGIKALRLDHFRYTHIQTHTSAHLRESDFHC